MKLIWIGGAIAVGGLTTLLAYPLYVANAKRRTAEADIAALEDSLAAFRRDFQRYPTTDEGLAALYEPPAELRANWKGPYVEHPISKDPWDHPYVYNGDPKSFTVISYGPDGRPGGDGINADMIGRSL